MPTERDLKINIQVLRPVMSGEKPRFGSVWTWGDDLPSIRLMALCRGLTKRDDVLLIEGQPTIYFLNLNTGEVERNWFWATEPGVSAATTWHCVDEGPAGSPRV